MKEIISKDFYDQIEVGRSDRAALSSVYSKAPNDVGGIKATRVRIYDDYTGKLLNDGHNKVILSGAEFAVGKFFEALSRVEKITPTYNDALGLDENLNINATSPEYMYLFCAGTSGCGKDPSQRYEAKYEEWTKPEDLIPFMYVDKDLDISDSLRNTYYGRRAAGNKIAYYFKKPENMDNPDYIRQYLDGTPIDSSVYNSTRTDQIVTMVQLRLKYLKGEGRAFFRATTGIDTARVNTISLCTAWPKLIDGKVYYQAIRPATRYNFPSIPLIDPELGLDIKYDLFF